MKWPWSKPKPLPIPPYQPVIHPPKHVEPAIVVEEIDTSQMTSTGVHRAWDKLAGKFKEN